jgi:Flp pilus assembly protein TadD
VTKPVLVSIVGAFVCALAAWQSARVGIARSEALYALKTNDVAAAGKAVNGLPADPEVHAARGIVLQRTDDYAGARRELERAVQLRPRDYFLWMMLGVTRDLDGDPAGGLAALRQSEEVAPGYAKPRWLLGNLLLRTGEIDEAFQQLRFAEERNRALTPAVIDLAWGVSRSDAARTLELVQPKSDDARMALAVFLAGHKQGAAAIDQFRLTKSQPQPVADQLIQRLVESKFYTEAFEVWTRSRCPACKPASFINGDFEAEIEIGNQLFGWQMPANINGVTPSVDAAEHSYGAKSLRLDFHGNTDPQTRLLSQFVIVEPGKQYAVSLYAMTRSFVSNAAPSVRVIDASGDKSNALGQIAIQPDATGWRPYSIYFTSGANTRAVQLLVNREDCRDNYCPAFGTLWLDAFSIEEARQIK